MSSQSSKVLVSGASGFVAAWIIRHLLEKGYNVRGTVRSSGKGEYLKMLYKEHGDKFEYVIVEDIEKVRALLRLETQIRCSDPP
jgi:nucleoside-diphosphate-sugar epimerase